MTTVWFACDFGKVLAVAAYKMLPDDDNKHEHFGITTWYLREKL